ncbi:BlaI/MecI/CopY family transcriptional regulator [Hugenholtzia roseola]|uniref:BlaI/MecI/CopY family transcriptional regulator n=1 Tax=Hugenholtzia roseola TaxID=1002 RepID=UPI0004210168|nr:BlaI/MecI/CopY family transcriptional regulator [Hugenholtzia roseola]
MQDQLRELTKAELQIMQLLWQLEKAFVKDLLEKIPEPKPNYNTVSTIIRILEQKGFVSHQAYGNTHQYYPLISQEQYQEFALKELTKNFFGGSLKSLLSFFMKKNDLSLEDLNDILNKEQDFDSKTKK